MIDIAYVEYSTICCVGSGPGCVAIGQIFEIMVIKNAGLPESDEARKYKYRLVFSGDRLVDQSFEKAIFQDLGSNPASLKSNKTFDLHGITMGHVIQQAGAELAYIQAELKGPPTWVMLPQ